MIDPLCAAPKFHGYASPLHLVDWWKSLVAADQAAWAAGIGTLLAAFAALLVWALSSYTAKRERQQQERFRARLVAIEAYENLFPLTFEINRARTAYKNAEKFFINGTVEHLKKILFLDSAASIPKGLKLDGLSEHFAIILAELGFLTGSYNRIISTLRFTEIPDSETLEALQSMEVLPMLKHIQEATVQAVEQIKVYVDEVDAQRFAIQE